MVKLFYDNGANIYEKDNCGHTPIFKGTYS